MCAAQLHFGTRFADIRFQTARDILAVCPLINKIEDCQQHQHIEK